MPKAFDTLITWARARRISLNWFLRSYWQIFLFCYCKNKDTLLLYKIEQLSSLISFCGIQNVYNSIQAFSSSSKVRKVLSKFNDRGMSRISVLALKRKYIFSNIFGEVD